MLGVPKTTQKPFVQQPLFRMLLAISMLALLMVIMYRMSKPSSWSWWSAATVEQEQKQLASLETSTATSNGQLSISSVVELSQILPFAGWGTVATSPANALLQTASYSLSEYLPLPELNKGATIVNRKAPYPDMRLLAGAADRRQFLTETFRLTEAPLGEKEKVIETNYRRDADARYHLLNLAKVSLTGDLEKDGRKNIRYQALVTKPNEYRGELITVTGSLNSVGESMEILRPEAGLEFCYPGMMMGDHSSHMYYLLFTDLPANMPESKSAWNQLFWQNMSFTGYFYKVVRMENHKDPSKPWFLPVLVGKSPITLANSTQTAAPSIMVPFLIFLAMLLPVVLVAGLGTWWFRRREKEHQQRMEAVRQRRANSGLDGMEWTT